MRFNPPNEGLRHAENVVWFKRRRTEGLAVYAVFLGIGGSIFVALALVIGGYWFAVSPLFLVIMGFFFIIRSFITGWLTKYFLTNERLIETRRGIIVREISMDTFGWKPLGHFLVKKRMRGVSDVQIYDPVSGDVLIELKDLDESSTRALERMGQMVKCASCGAENPANSSECRRCGASL